MTLTLRIENYDVLSDGGPLSVSVTGKNLQIGRSPSMDWTLPDPDRHISSHHFDVKYDNGTYYLSDVSTNGVFFDGSRHRLSAPHPLQQGDRFQVGHYFILVDVGAALAPVTAVPVIGASVPGLQSPPMQASEPADPWAIGGAAPIAPINPNPRPNRDPLADFSGDFIVNPFADAAAPSPVAPVAPAPVAPPPAPTGAGSPFTPMSSGIAAPPAPAAMPGGAPAAAPSPSPNMAAPVPPAPAPLSMPPNMAQPQQPAAAAPNNQAIIAAFCEGAGLSPDMVADTDPVTLARELGRTMRVTSQELMAMLQDRASAKKFTKGGERTMMGAEENNPLKFLPDAQQALEVMFLKPRPGFMMGGSGVDNALGDVRLHQMAVFAAIQPALIKLLEDIAPEAIEDEGGGGGLLGAGSGKRKAWDTFVERWDKKVAGHENGMLGAFLSHFAEAYVAAVAASRR